MYENSTVTRARSVAWLSLVFSVVALLFAISAYGVSRTGAAPADRLDERGTSTATSTLQSARSEASQELEAARANLRDEGNYGAAAAQLSQTETRLMEAYRDADRQSSEEWQNLQGSFDELEAALRGQSADALRLLENLMANLAKDVEVDGKPQEVGE